MLADLDRIAKRHSTLNLDERAHLRRLVTSWVALSDFSFADLLLFAPVKSKEGEGSAWRTVSGDPAELVTMAHARPATAQTLYPKDQIGRFQTFELRPLVTAALRSGQIESQITDEPEHGEVRVTAVPVRFEGNVIAIMTREATRSDERIHGKLQRSYSDVSNRLISMIASGVFPFKHEDALTEETPRVGDGALILDRERRICYSSPNAVSALHRTGFHGEVEGRRLGELGFSGDVVEEAYRVQMPAVDELERGETVSILARILPLVSNSGVTDGAVVLVRDVSDIRHRDRLLVSMDTTIREIHHRVKNNLQTVSSLLRLQARRVDSQEAKDAIGESVRRIASIANVHDLLSNANSDNVLLGDVVQPILKMIHTGLVSPDVPIEFRLVGKGPMLVSSLASSLAVLVTELVQNAVEHGYPPGSEGGTVIVELISDESTLTVLVKDDGIGLPEEFDLPASAGLGLTIAQTLASHELNGSLCIESRDPGPGTIARMDLDLKQ